MNTSIGLPRHAPEESISGRRGPGKCIVDGASFRLADEIRYITRRAAEHDGRVGQLTLFSTETGDAWIIDREDHLALRLAHQGDLEPFDIEETTTSFAIDWKGLYRIALRGCGFPRCQRFNVCFAFGFAVLHNYGTQRKFGEC